MYTEERTNHAATKNDKATKVQQIRSDGDVQCRAPHGNQKVNTFVRHNVSTKTHIHTHTYDPVP